MNKSELMYPIETLATLKAIRAYGFNTDKIKDAVLKEVSKQLCMGEEVTAIQLEGWVKEDATLHMKEEARAHMEEK